MKIYTGRGDTGETDILGGIRVSKTDPLVVAYGTVDELNSAIGVANSSLTEGQHSLKENLTRIQNHLHMICANLASARSEKQKDTITSAQIHWLEDCCDFYEERLPELRHFILPGGTFSASLMHQARTTCRRAERSILTAAQSDELDIQLQVYLNRLSDLLFLMARYLNHLAGYEENRPDYKTP